ncbi:MAG TPA: hypothetical protein VI454_20665 [Verrucomicrobiae bacterium]
MLQLTIETRNHFWIVISSVKNGQVLAVNITDACHCPESPCKLLVGDHPVITKPSVVFYRKARLFDASAVDEQLKDGSSVRRLDDCSEALLKRIIKGAFESDDITRKLLDHLR